MKSRSALVFLIGIAAASVIAYFAVISLHHWSCLSYISRRSGVELPSGLTNISAWDNGEHFVVAHVTIPMDKINPFIERNGFHRVDHETDDTAELYTITFSDFLNERYQRIPQSACWCLKVGIRLYPCIFKLDRETGDLWVQVNYPDWAGDPPGLPPSAYEEIPRPKPRTAK